jgi:hypothetical protein
MNIFVVSRDPIACALALDDKRLNKMVLETAQLLCSAINLEADAHVAPYKTSHATHPITLWTLSDIHHQRWLYQLGIAYGNEIIHRKGRKHSSHLVIEGLSFRWPELAKRGRRLEDDEFFNGARHKKLGLDFTHLPVRKAYRSYLRARWPGDKRKPVWTNREPPSWYP